MGSSKGPPDSVGVRLQKMVPQDQTLALARMAEARLGGAFSPKDIVDLFHETSLPCPTNVWDVVARLGRKGLLTSATKGQWRLTPVGRAESSGLLSDID